MIRRTKDYILEYTFDQPTGCDYKVLVYDGKNYYTINNGTYRLNTGTYYFIVMASSMNYSCLLYTSKGFAEQAVHTNLLTNAACALNAPYIVLIL